jgi:hypothetical protein
MRHGHYDPFEDLDESRRNILFISNECNNDEDDLHRFDRQPLRILSKKSCSWTASELLAMLGEPAGMLSRSQPNSQWKYILHHPQWHDGLWREADREGRYVLHHLAVSCSTQRISRGISPRECTWIFAKALQVGADLHIRSKGERGDTPLILFLKSIRLWSYSVIDDLDSVLRFWVEILAEVGVDICQYGQRESELWSGGFPLSDWRSSFGIRIIGFTHGSTPSEWRLLVEKPGDAFAGIFWDMVENYKHIPGSWVDTEVVWDELYFTERAEMAIRLRNSQLSK